MVLGLVIGAVAAAYVIPRMGATVWGYGTTAIGKTFATWAVVAVLYDALVNTGESTFTLQDFALTGAVTLGTRVVL